MKRIVFFIASLLLTITGFSQTKPDYIRTPNSNNTIVDWNLKAKTFILPHFNKLSPPVYQDTIGSIFLNTDTTDKHIYFRYKIGSGGIISLGNFADRPYKFDANFRLSADSVHLAGTIHLKSTVIADTSMRIGTSTMPGWNSIYRILNMAGDVGIRSHVGAHDVMLFNNLYNSDGSQIWNYTTTGFGSYLYLDNGGGMNFYSVPSATAGSRVSITTPIFSITRAGATLTSLKDTTGVDTSVVLRNGKLYKQIGGTYTASNGITKTGNNFSADTAWLHNTAGFAKLSGGNTYSGTQVFNDMIKGPSGGPSWSISNTSFNLSGAFDESVSSNASLDGITINPGLNIGYTNSSPIYLAFQGPTAGQWPWIIRPRSSDSLVVIYGTLSTSSPLLSIHPDHTTWDGLGHRFITTADGVSATPAWSSITGKPTTLSGYGITDAVNLTTAQSNIQGIKQFMSPQSIGGAYDLHRNIVSGYPASVLDVVNDYGNNGGLYLAQFTAYADDTGEANFHYRKARGTAAAPTAILAGDFLFSAGFQGYGATGFQASSAAIQALATENFTDTNNGTKMQFQVTPNGSSLANRITALTIDQTGYTGLGYTDPQTQMEVLGTSRVSSAATQSFSQLVRYNGTRTAPTALATNDFIGLLSFVGQYDATVGHLATGAFIGSYAESAWTSSTVHPTYMAFYTSPASGSYAERMRIAGNGNVGIGTTSSASRLNLAAGTTTTGAFNVAAGSVLTTPQSGTFEYNGTNIFFTDNTNSRKKIAYTAYVDSSFSATTTYFTPGMFSGLGTAGSNYNWGTNTIPMSALATTGTASSTTVLHGDGSWSAVSGGFANPMTTQGDLIKGGASGAATRVPLGGANQVLGVNTGATDVEYKTISGTNGVTFTPGSGTLAFSFDQSFSPTLTGIYTFATTNTASSGTGSVNYGTYLHHTVNQTSTAGFTDLLINRVNTAPGSGSQRLLDMQVGGSSVFNVNTSGGLTLNSGVTSNGIFTANQYSTSSTFSSDGLYIYNSATSASGTPSLNSLRVHWMASVWNTTATAAPNYANMISELRTTSGTTPTYKLAFAGNLSTTTTPGTFTDLAFLYSDGNFQATKSIRGTAVTFANVPTSAVEGMLIPVTDSTTSTYGATITGGGTNHVLAYYNGTNWTVH